MCGIVGLLRGQIRGSQASPRELLAEMTPKMAHRGPDDEGIWDDVDVGVGLGHCRLAVLDVSEAGHQPMTSRSGRYVTTYNGEIYNFLEIRKTLASLGHEFRGHSDTEVLLAGVEQWGLDGVLDRAIGMFAFALWDREARELFLVRDRIGEKPLYFGTVAGDFVFASELKALRPHPGWSGEIDREALSLFMRKGLVPAPYSIYRGLFKLMPGEILRIPHGFDFTTGSYGDYGSLIRSYWSAKKVVEEATETPFGTSEVETVARLDSLLREVIAEHLSADVPLGAFLSGGIDSSTVVSLMQAVGSRPVRTFTVGFGESGFDEARDARSIADHLGTEHTEMYVSAREARDVIPELPTVYDEPFADSSQIPTLIISQLARQHVKVALTGDGGDELFGGYNRYMWGKWAQKYLGLMPRPLRRTIAFALMRRSTVNWDRYYGFVSRALPRTMKVQNPGDKIHALANVLQRDSLEDFYSALVEKGGWPETVVFGDRRSEPLSISRNGTSNLANDALQMMYRDLVGYLPDDILTKVDRASMSTSLETRAPFVDRRVVEHAWKIPISMKLRPGRSKWILRQVLDRYVPAKLVDRPKTGFAVPVGSWLRGPLKDWAEDLLNEKSLRDDGLLNSDMVRSRWSSHLAGTGNFHQDLWSVLMLRSWIKENSIRI